MISIMILSYLLLVFEPQIWLKAFYAANFGKENMISDTVHNT